MATDNELTVQGQLLSLQMSLAYAIALARRSAGPEAEPLAEVRDDLIANLQEVSAAKVAGAEGDWIKLQLAFEKSIERIFTFASAYETRLSASDSDEE